MTTSYMASTVTQFIEQKQDIGDVAAYLVIGDVVFLDHDSGKGSKFK